MKKIMALLAAVGLLLMSAAFADGAPDLYDLYIHTADGDTWIGTAIPILDGVLVTSAAVLNDAPEGSLTVRDGKKSREAAAISVLDGKMLVVLFDAENDKPAIPSYDFAQEGKETMQGLVVRSGDWMQSRINRAVYDAARIVWQGQSAVVMTLSGKTDLGAPVLTPDGKLAGMVAAEYAEGGNRYVMLPVQVITAGIQEAADELEGNSKGLQDTRPQGYTVSLEGNVAVFSWEKVQLPETEEGQRLFHIVADVDSSYLTYNEIVSGATSLSMILTPGRTYISGFRVFDGDKIPDELPEKFAVTSLPEAEPLDQYGFRSIRFGIAEMPADAPSGTLPTPVDEVTETLLRSGRACIYSLSSYESFDKNATDGTYSLLLTLTTPEGSNYRYESGWTYEPELKEHDEWAVGMDDEGMLNLLNESGYPEGTYELCMYIDGKLADRVTFELIK